jgi:hypothetical protein
MNTFVDCPRGLTFDQSQLLPRRLIPRYDKDGKRKIDKTNSEKMNSESPAKEPLDLVLEL